MSFFSWVSTCAPPGEEPTLTTTHQWWVRMSSQVTFAVRAHHSQQQQAHRLCSSGLRLRSSVGRGDTWPEQGGQLQGGEPEVVVFGRFHPCRFRQDRGAESDRALVAVPSEENVRVVLRRCVLPQVGDLCCDRRGDRQGAGEHTGEHVERVRADGCFTPHVFHRVGDHRA